MWQQLTTLFSHRSFLVKSVKIDQRGELARSVGNRGVTWVITQRDLSLWATRLLLNKSDKVKQTWLQVFWFCWTNAKTHAKQKLWNSLTKKRDYNWSSGWALPGDLGALSFCEIPIPEIIWIFHPFDHSCKKIVFQVTYCCVLWQSALLYCVRHSCSYCDNKCAKHQQSQCEVDFCLLTVWHTSRYRLVVTRWPSTNSNTFYITKIQFFANF